MIVEKGISKSRAASLTGISRSMVYYEKRNRQEIYDSDLEDLISDIVKDRPSYGTRTINAMVRRNGIRIGRNRVRRYMRHMNLITASRKKTTRKHVPRTIVAGRPNMM